MFLKTMLTVQKRLRMANRAGASCTEVGSEGATCKIKLDLIDRGKNILSYLVAQTPISPAELGRLTWRYLH